MKMVQVIWIDAIGGHGDWEHMPGRKPTPPLICHSAGWVLHDDEHYLEIAQTVADMGGSREQITNTISIPKVAIKSIVRVRTAHLNVDT